METGFSFEPLSSQEISDISFALFLQENGLQHLAPVRDRVRDALQSFIPLVQVIKESTLPNLERPNIDVSGQVKGVLDRFWFKGSQE